MLSTSDLVGQPLIINVWNSTCGPCKRELPAFAAVHAELGDRDPLRRDQQPRHARDRTSRSPRERGVGYELLRDVDDGFASTVGIATLPVTLFVAADGTIVRQTGVLEEDDLRRVRRGAARMNLSLSFIRGMIAAVNPCGFILLPTYLLYFLGLSDDRCRHRQRAPIGRALVVSAAVSGGFLSVFLVVGLITEIFTQASWINENAKYATAVIGVLLVVLGLAMLFGYRLPIVTPKLDAGGRDRTVWSMFVYGIAYAVASIGCTIGLFVATLFGTAEREGTSPVSRTITAYGARHGADRDGAHGRARGRQGRPAARAAPRDAVRRDGRRRVRAAVRRCTCCGTSGRSTCRRPATRSATRCRATRPTCSGSSTTTGAVSRSCCSAIVAAAVTYVGRQPPHATAGRRVSEPFAELLATPGVEEVCELRGRFGFMAYHGGHLEEMTDVIARAAAERSGASYYGVHQPKGLDWHIPSIKVSPRRLADRSPRSSSTSTS